MPAGIPLQCGLYSILLQPFFRFPDTVPDFGHHRISGLLFPVAEAQIYLPAVDIVSLHILYKSGEPDGW